MKEHKKDHTKNHKNISIHIDKLMLILIIYQKATTTNYESEML